MNILRCIVNQSHNTVIFYIRYVLCLYLRKSKTSGCKIDEELL